MRSIQLLTHVTLSHCQSLSLFLHSLKVSHAGGNPFPGIVDLAEVFVVLSRLLPLSALRKCPSQWRMVQEKKTPLDQARWGFLTPVIAPRMSLSLGGVTLRRYKGTISPSSVIRCITRSCWSPCWFLIGLLWRTGFLWIIFNFGRPGNGLSFVIIISSLSSPSSSSFPFTREGSVGDRSGRRQLVDGRVVLRSLVGLWSWPSFFEPLGATIPEIMVLWVRHI